MGVILFKKCEHKLCDAPLNYKQCVIINHYAEVLFACWETEGIHGMNFYYTCFILIFKPLFLEMFKLNYAGLLKICFTIILNTGEHGKSIAYN